MNGDWRQYSSEVNECKRKGLIFNCVKSVVYPVYPIRVKKMEIFLLDERKQLLRNLGWHHCPYKSTFCKQRCTVVYSALEFYNWVLET